MTSASAHRCALCGRDVPRLTRHHLIPQSRSRKRKRRGQLHKRADGAEIVNGRERPAADVTIGLCSACHHMVHATLTEKELEAAYHSVASLLAHPEIGRFAGWAAKQDPARRIAVRRSRGRRGDGAARRRGRGA